MQTRAKLASELVPGDSVVFLNPGGATIAEVRFIVHVSQKRPNNRMFPSCSVIDMIALRYNHTERGTDIHSFTWVYDERCEVL